MSGFGPKIAVAAEPGSILERVNMETKTILRGLATAFVVAGATINASAQELYVHIKGLGNGTQSILEFYGSVTYSGPGTSFRANSAAMEEWKGSGAANDYVTGGTYDDYINQILSGKARVTVGGDTKYIDYVNIDHDGSGDDFGFSVKGGTDMTVNNGDVVTFAGRGLFNIAAGNLNPGTYNFTNINGNGPLPLNVKVSTVPEPGEWAAMGILGAGLVGLMARARRRNG
jgi:hypothetical protein